MISEKTQETINSYPFGLGVMPVVIEYTKEIQKQFEQERDAFVLEFVRFAWYELRYNEVYKHDVPKMETLLEQFKQSKKP